MDMIEDKSSKSGCYVSKRGNQWGVYFPIGYNHFYATTARTATHEFAPFGSRSTAQMAFMAEEWDY